MNGSCTCIATKFSNPKKKKKENKKDKTTFL